MDFERNTQASETSGPRSPASRYGRLILDVPLVPGKICQLCFWRIFAEMMFRISSFRVQQLLNSRLPRGRAVKSKQVRFLRLRLRPYSTSGATPSPARPHPASAPFPLKNGMTVAHLQTGLPGFPARLIYIEISILPGATTTPPPSPPSHHPHHPTPHPVATTAFVFV